VLIPSLLALAGLVLLAVAADHLVLGSSRLATRLRISPVVVGVVVIGLGTSAPEFLVSGLAAARGDIGIAVGNIVGSNILNLTLILGVAAAIGPIGVSSTIIRREVRLSVVAVALFAVLTWVGLGRWTGTVLGLAMVGVLWLLLHWAGQGRNTEIADETTDYTGSPAVVDVPVPPAHVPTWAEPIRAALGLVGVLIGAQLLVVNASTIAENLGVPQVIIGLTLVALGTSVPELVTTIAAQRRGEAELVVGNLFGSNLFNSLAGGAVIGLFAGRAPAEPANLALLVAMVLTAVIAWALLRRGLRLTRLEGVILLVIYAAILPLVLAS
jgi:cation:H+ antiporter